MNKENIYSYFVEYLSNNKKDLSLVSYSLSEEDGLANIQLSLAEDGEAKTISASGVGLVDAAFGALMSHYASEYRSLGTIALTDAYFSTDFSKKTPGSNMKSRMEINLEFENHSKSKTSFKDRAASLGYTAVKIVVKAVEFYVNCELLFKRLSYLIKDANSRGRSDLESGYRYALSQVVQVTNYRAVIEN